jgi:hypothetical protein
MAGRMCPVQNAVIGMILGATFIGLTLVALRSRHDGWQGATVRLGIGILIGGVAAAAAVAIREDMVADDVELTVAAAVLILASIALIAIVAQHRGE